MGTPFVEALTATTPSNQESVAALEQLTQHAWQMTDPALLALALTRVGQLLRCELLVDEVVPPPRDTREADARRAVSSWPTSSVHTELERACLAYVEQFELDPSSVEQHHIDAVLAHLDVQSFFAFASALHVVDSGLRVLAVARQLATGAPGTTFGRQP